MRALTVKKTGGSLTLLAALGSISYAASEAYQAYQKTEQARIICLNEIETVRRLRQQIHDDKVYNGVLHRWLGAKAPAELPPIGDVIEGD